MFVNYGRKKFYNIGPWMLKLISPVVRNSPWTDVIKFYFLYLTLLNNKLQCLPFIIFVVKL
jgi:hypothetical protein